MHAIYSTKYNIKQLQCRKQMIHGQIVQRDEEKEKETGYKQSVTISVFVCGNIGRNNRKINIMMISNRIYCFKCVWAGKGHGIDTMKENKRATTADRERERERAGNSTAFQID